jgi:hypothetical protein
LPSAEWLPADIFAEKDDRDDCGYGDAENSTAEARSQARKSDHPEEAAATPKLTTLVSVVTQAIIAGEVAIATPATPAIRLLKVL